MPLGSGDCRDALWVCCNCTAKEMLVEFFSLQDESGALFWPLDGFDGCWMTGGVQLCASVPNQ